MAFKFYKKQNNCDIKICVYEKSVCSGDGICFSALCCDNNMDTDKIAKKAIKIILVTAGISLVFLIISPFFISPEEGSTFETLMLIPVIPIIMVAVILVVLARSKLYRNLLKKWQNQ